MIEQYLSNKNENATVSKAKKFPELNKAAVTLLAKQGYMMLADTASEVQSQSQHRQGPLSREG